ncbi:MAG: DUF6273 domain-containing protein [Prevotella sp.]|jgi:DNA-directed RNA polymerase subunit M/transcription elongation factor TFIIS|nr:DUF6273 domain-containing protein [Prevotella sp.]
MSDTIRKAQLYSGVESLLSQVTNIKIGDIVELGAYPQTATGDDKTPIAWYVIRIEDDNIMLLSKYILDNMPITEGTPHITWADCSLRKWLNEDFYHTVFDEKERGITVLNICKDNGHKVTRAEFGGNVSMVCKAAKDTEDYVFLLSENEINELDKNLDKRTHVGGVGTEFSKQEKFSKKRKKDVKLSVCERNGFSTWWLRTRSSDKFRATFQTMYVRCYEGNVTYPYDDGEYFEDHVGEVNRSGDPSDNNNGIRPAIVIKLSR